VFCFVLGTADFFHFFAQSSIAVRSCRCWLTWEEKKIKESISQILNHEKSRKEKGSDESFLGEAVSTVLEGAQATAHKLHRAKNFTHPREKTLHLQEIPSFGERFGQSG
jgi:hypothetical protein